nr:MAG TPA: hypothetical protein [Caudoviricetes sp.]
MNQSAIFASLLMEYEIECIIRGIKSDLDSQGF